MSKADTVFFQRVKRCGTWFYERRPSWRAFVLAALWLVLIDLGLRQLAQLDMQNDDFVLPWRSSALAPEYAATLREHDGPVVAMIGDSTLQRLPHLPDTQTLPHLIEVRLRELSGNDRWEVANFGLSGAHSADLHNLSRLLPDNIDYVVVTLNYKFLGPLGMKPREIFPELIPPELADAETRRQVWRRYLHEHWFTLRNGAWVADRIFGDRPGNWLRRKCSETAATVMGEESAREDRWTPAYINKMRRAMSVPPLVNGNPAIHHLGEMLLYLNSRGWPTVVYVTPFDWEKVEHFGIAKKWQVMQHLNHLGLRIERQTGAVFVNLCDIGRSDWFIDMDHLTETGRRELAEVLVQRVMMRRLPARNGR